MEVGEGFIGGPEEGHPGRGAETKSLVVFGVEIIRYAAPDPKNPDNPQARVEDKAGKTEAAIPIYMFMPNTVRDRAIKEHGELISKMRRAGMRATNMCGVSYAGMKGFSERVRGVTNSAKTRNYSSVRYFPDEILVQIIVRRATPQCCSIRSVSI